MNDATTKTRTFRFGLLSFILVITVIGIAIGCAANLLRPHVTVAVIRGECFMDRIKNLESAADPDESLNIYSRLEAINTSSEFNEIKSRINEFIQERCNEDVRLTSLWKDESIRGKDVSLDSISLGDLGIGGFQVTYRYPGYSVSESIGVYEFVYRESRTELRRITKNRNDAFEQKVNDFLIAQLGNESNSR